jgi:hypothetical protein
MFAGTCGLRGDMQPPANVNRLHFTNAGPTQKLVTMRRKCTTCSGTRQPFSCISSLSLDSVLQPVCQPACLQCDSPSEEHGRVDALIGQTSSREPLLVGGGRATVCVLGCSGQQKRLPFNGGAGRQLARPACSAALVAGRARAPRFPWQQTWPGRQEPERAHECAALAGWARGASLAGGGGSSARALGGALRAARPSWRAGILSCAAASPAGWWRPARSPTSRGDRRAEPGPAQVARISRLR